ncbi:GNAT family N-acetyltransferase [Clostridioides sp. ES-S-0005-03]|uniref:GNAT family N-acetyltransferase n=1 Tax=unclassified Clostridioides TaxID=2635829 RepID=UPI001D0C50BF|nr:GNAT family N-acetyltransferase [Clostridioides sp. ES-S-0005-03]MCC0762446.1 GNAT family N-acetyltransferase [Clostridioides sp. ES-S-0006-03]UDN48171.1 GNAT family N-acetyltransferase [Clostridioides sp. ES-S-0173-01]
MYSLRKLEEKDIEMVKSWLYQEYIVKWFGDASDWLNEIKGRNNEYNFIHHFIVESEHKAIGFCQYYNYNQSPLEDSEIPQPNGTYGIDYLIGEKNLLGKSIGKQLVKLISDKVIEENKNVVRIVADPIIEETRTNVASIKVLEANQFCYDEKSNLYKKDIKDI